MTTEIVKVNASDYGIEESRAKEVEAVFTPMLQKMVELEEEYNQVLKLELTNETCQKAGDLRRKYVKVRTGTAEIHKKAKAFYLNGGRFIDGWKNAQLFVSQEKEETLEKIEKHFENQERERKAKLREERAALIAPYVEDTSLLILAEMTEEAFNIMLAGAKSQYELKIAAEKKAEEDRIAAEKVVKLHNERKDSVLNLWNYMAPEDASKNFGSMDDGSWTVLYEGLLQKKQVADKKRKEDEAERERLRKEAEKKEQELAAERKKAAEEQAKRDAEIKAERERVAALEAEKRKQDEAKAEEERKAKDAEKKAARAPDKTKLLNLALDLDNFPLPELKTAEAEVIKENIRQLISKTTAYIRTKANEL